MLASAPGRAGLHRHGRAAGAGKPYAARNAGLRPAVLAGLRPDDRAPWRTGPLGGGDCVAAQTAGLTRAGRPCPAVMPLIFSAMAAPPFRAHSLNGAAPSSSWIRWPSRRREGRRATPFTSYLQATWILTM